MVKMRKNYVLIKEEQAGEVTTKSGIVLLSSQNLNQHYRVGKLISVGVDAQEGGLLEGDTVFFDVYSGRELTIEEEVFFVCDADKVIGVITDGK